MIAKLPSDTVGAVFIAEGIVVEPDPANLAVYTRHEGSLGGSWPADPAVAGLMRQKLGVEGT